MFLTALTLLIATSQNAPPAVLAPPELSAEILIENGAVQPGQSTAIAVRLALPAPWHMYHPVVLGPGAPTTVEWELPAGVTIDPVRFTTPKLASALGQEYLGLDGEFFAVSTLRLAADARLDPPIEVAARVRGIACATSCVPVSATARLVLPAPSSQIGDAASWARVAERMPALLSEAPYLGGSRLLASHTQIPAGAAGELALLLTVEAGHHIQDRNPGVEGLVAARVFFDESTPLKIDSAAQRWPEPKVRDIEFLGKVREQGGRVVIVTPFRVPLETKPGRVQIRTLVQYQACNDAGTCFAPMMAEAVAELDVVAAGAPAVANADPLLSELKRAAPSGQPSSSGGRGADGGSNSLAWVLLLAFVGGVILNIMPCVLPVISLKILGFAQQAGDEPGRVLRMGLIYTAGILVSFVPVAIAIGWGGAAWGGLMQQPSFVIVLVGVVFAFALSLLGVFEIQLPGSAAAAAGELAGREGYGGAFFNGVMTTALATPCTAPLLGPAIGVLTQFPPAIAASGIMMVGLGLAAPYLLLSAFPAWLRFLPRPGPWMITFKQIVGFVLLGVVLWLLSVVSEQVELPRLLAALALLLAVGLACWLLGRVRLGTPAGRAWATWAAAAAVVAGGWFGGQGWFVENSRINWVAWEPGLAERLAGQGHTVYVDYTANWCLTCRSNKFFVLETDRIRAEFERLKVVAVKADFTRHDERILAELVRHGRKGVPLNVVFPAGQPDQPILLPELLTQQVVLASLAKAGPSTSDQAVAAAVAAP